MRMYRPDTDTRHAVRFNLTSPDPEERCFPGARAADGQDEVALDQQHKEPYEAPEISARTGIIAVGYGAVPVVITEPEPGALRRRVPQVRMMIRRGGYPQMSMARGRDGGRTQSGGVKGVIALDRA